MHRFKLLLCFLILCGFDWSSQPRSAKAQRPSAESRAATPALVWKDRRPIGTLFLGNSPAYTDGNPRMWLNSKDLVLSTAQGRQAFSQRMMRIADDTVQYLKEINGQGVIVFDIEGIEAPHPDYTWVGDPRLLKERAPEMDAIADEFLKKFKDARLRVGVTIRSQFMYPYKTPLPKEWWKTDKNLAHYWSYKTQDDAVKEVGAKIDYAIKRWGATLFYIDSNNYEWPEVIARLQQRFPAVLLIPEHTGSDPIYFSMSAPLERLDYLYFDEKKEHRRQAHPDGFKAILMRDPETFKKKYQVDLYTYLLPKVQAGDILMINAWYPDPAHQVVKTLYRDVYGAKCCMKEYGRAK